MIDNKNNLTDMEIKNIIEKLGYPNIFFDGGFYNEDSIEFSLEYEIIHNYTKEYIDIILDKNLNIIHMK
jgi:hypothetical protein